MLIEVGSSDVLKTVSVVGGGCTMASMMNEAESWTAGAMSSSMSRGAR